MKRILVLPVLLGAMLGASCGVSKQYVNDSIATSEARTTLKTDELAAQTALLADEVRRLDALAIELEKKQHTTISSVAGFEQYQVIWSGEVSFGFNSYDLTNHSREVLDQAALAMQQTPGSLIELVGHTDATGPQTYNQLLGQHRAESTRRYLADRHNIMLFRMFTMSEGEDKPAAAGDSRNGAGKNRRVMIRVWGVPQQASTGN